MRGQLLVRIVNAAFWSLAAGSLAILLAWSELPNGSVTEAARISLVRRLCVSGEAKRIREACQLSLAEVGAAVGSSGTQIAKWERGVVPRKRETILAYGELLAELLEQQ